MKDRRDLGDEPGDLAQIVVVQPPLAVKTMGLGDSSQCLGEAVAGLLLENVFIRRLYGRDHLAQVLLSFGLILVLDDIRQIVFGKDVHSVAPPKFLSGSIQARMNVRWVST